MGSTSNSSEQFNIRWKNYTSVLQSVFRDLLEEERLVDVTLACEGGFIKCHRIILSACSSYFENLLTELQSDPHLVIFMKDLKLWELQALIHFMYNGEVSVKQNRLAPLVRAAASLHIRGLSTDSDDKPRGGGGNGGVRETNESFADHQPKKMARRPSLGVRSDQKAATPAPVQSVKRSSTTSNGGSVVPAKIMRGKKVEDNYEPSTSASASLLQNRSKMTIKKNPAVEAEDTTASEMTGEEAEDGDIQDEDDLADKFSESAEGDGDAVDETYSDTENVYEDGSQFCETTASPVYVSEARSGGMMFVDPPITEPVVDAADRATRLKKATDLALSGITVRQAAAHYGIPRTTLCAYMKRRGLSGKKLSPAISNYQYQNHYQQVGNSVAADSSGDYNEENEFPFMGLADLVKQQHYEIQQDSC